MDLTITQMMQMQQELFESHKNEWTPMEPQYGKDFILYMMEEIGEVIAIIKKKGSSAVIEDEQVRQAFLEEMSDVLMYYHDLLLRFQVTPEEIAQAYLAKHEQNMNRDFRRQYEELYHDGKD